MSEKEKLPIGTNIKVARAKKNMTICELSTKTGISISAISQIECGIHKPRVNTLNKIASALGIDVENLFI